MQSPPSSSCVDICLFIVPSASLPGIPLSTPFSSGPCLAAAAAPCLSEAFLLPCPLIGSRGPGNSGAPAATRVCSPNQSAGEERGSQSGAKAKLSQYTVPCCKTLRPPSFPLRSGLIMATMLMTVLNNMHSAFCFVGKWGGGNCKLRRGGGKKKAKHQRKEKGWIWAPLFQCVPPPATAAATPPSGEESEWALPASQTCQWLLGESERKRGM